MARGKSGVYQILNIINCKKYIGSSNNIGVRWLLHKSLLRRGKHHSSHLQAAWGKYGKESFKFEILTLCPEEKLIEVEQFYFDSLRPDYNACPCAGRTGGSPRSEEVRKKMSEAQKGRIVTKEARLKISAAAKKQFASPEAREQMSNIKKKYFESDAGKEARQKISDVQRGRIVSLETKAKKSDAMKAICADPEYREKQLSSLIKTRSNPQYRAKLSASVTASWEVRKTGAKVLNQ